eukprot:SAG31_NODE_6116_length_2164_cov_1.497337_1_plen_245_part_00
MSTGGRKGGEAGAGHVPNRHVIVIGATNRPDSIDPALRRAGRFDREITLGIPDEPARARILQTLTRGMCISEDLSWPQLARATPGFVGADLRALTREAGTVAIKRIFGTLGKHRHAGLRQIHHEAETALQPGGDSSSSKSEASGHDSALSTEPADVSDDCEGRQPQTHFNEDTAAPTATEESQLDWNSSMAEPVTNAEMAALSITMADFLAALPNVQPSAKREGFATIPNVSFKDVVREPHSRS